MLEADGNAVVQKEFPRDISTSTATASTGVTGGAAGGVQRRMFDAVFTPQCSNDTLATHLRPVVDHVLAGYNSMPLTTSTTFTPFATYSTPFTPSYIYSSPLLPILSL